MPRFTRLQVLNKVNEAKVVPLFYHKDIDICRNVVKACYDGGLHVFEFTNRGDNANEIFNEINKIAAKEMPELVLGIGSVIEPSTAAMYIQMGAAFIVSPILNEDMAKMCNRRKVAWMPGCMTVSEISKAEELGAEFVKIFPADLGGPNFIKAVKGPMPWTQIMTTGGVTPEADNLKAWFGAGAAAVGMGSQLVTKDIVANKDWAKLTAICKEVVKTVNGIFGK
jgi:2-dehydro-3-deoxyphosphogluconate aldolase / (4S)-4-hydroxy-2-oxoglutarate aldolase